MKDFEPKKMGYEAPKPKETEVDKARKELKALDDFNLEGVDIDQLPDNYIQLYIDYKLGNLTEGNITEEEFKLETTDIGEQRKFLAFLRNQLQIGPQDPRRI